MKNLKERHNLKDTDEEGGIILKFTFNELYEK
jgi:hypothetical protein